MGIYQKTAAQNSNCINMDTSLGSTSICRSVKTLPDIAAAEVIAMMDGFSISTKIDFLGTLQDMG